MSTDDRVYAYNEVSGEVKLLPKRFLSHPIFGKNLREVGSGKKRKIIRALIAEPAEPAVTPYQDEAEDTPVLDSINEREDGE